MSVCSLTWQSHHNAKPCSTPCAAMWSRISAAAWREGHASSIKMKYQTTSSVPPGDCGHLPAHGGGHGGVHSEGGRQRLGLREVSFQPPACTRATAYGAAAATRPPLVTCCSMSRHALAQCAGIGCHTSLGTPTTLRVLLADCLVFWSCVSIECRPQVLPLCGRSCWHRAVRPVGGQRP